jgi:argininosuccinate lyase
MKRLWDRWESLDEDVLTFTAGDDPSLDERLIPYDLRATAAHAAMLHDSGFLSLADHDALQAAIGELLASHKSGEWRIAPDEEDGHTAIENRLVALTGDAGRAVHLGRSRNDQVLAALRPWLKDRLDELAAAAILVSEVLDAISAANVSTVMPGYTHLQRAMPSTVGLWAGAFSAEIRDDGDGLVLAKRRADRNPLGSAAGYGVPVLSLDREHTTRGLGFQRTHQPVTAVQLSRGKAEATALFEAAMLAQDLGRLAADICLFASAEFGFVHLPASITTGSSMLPQKRNPDVFEIARGRTAEAFAALQEVMLITAKMTSGYHRDLQLIKRPLFRGLDGVLQTARVMARVLPLVEFDTDRLAAAMDPSMDMAARANRLVRDTGIPFREAYRLVRDDPTAGIT